MPARSAEEKAERQVLAARKKAEREAKKKAKETEEKALKDAAEASRKAALLANQGKSGGDGTCWIVTLPEVALRQIWLFLSARELGCTISTCQQWNRALLETRYSFIMQQLNLTRLCLDQTEARTILDASYGGGNTKRCITLKQKKSQGRGDCDEFIGYARFLEEGVRGYCCFKTTCGSKQKTQPTSILTTPVCINGRFASCSPEHSLTRIGGDGTHSGPGGSGVAAWGVGRRGQLGTGNRDDVARPVRLFGNLGYGIRIVQVSAGGGLVRVAHSLFLTDAGRVLSCGNGSYGQLGHGYSGAKQLPDFMKPTYISFFSGMHITCVSAGEIHSAAVNSDGDLFTFGDGFLGMLGHADKRPQVSPKQVDKGGLEDECVLSVACGCRHTLVITEEGDVWSMGFGRYGVLGRSFSPYEHDPAVVMDGGDLAEDVGFVGTTAPSAEEVAEALRIREQAALDQHMDLINMTLDDLSDQCIPKLIDSLKGIKIVGTSAGHRHSIFLDDNGEVYTCGSGVTGALGHGDNMSHMYPMKVMEFVNENITIRQISAGVDMSMAVSTEGKVYSWGKADRGRIGLGEISGVVNTPRHVQLTQPKSGIPLKAIDVECGYVHSLIVGIDGTLHQCGEVGINGADDGQLLPNSEGKLGLPVKLDDLNIWHRLPEPMEAVKVAEKWKKYGKYEVTGRSKMLGRS